MNAQPLRAYHSDPAIKAKYLDRVRAHRAADVITQGVGGENGKGCAIGCTLEAYDHSRYPVELGLPEWLARLEDSIFENLPKAEAMVWPESFLEAIQPGVNLEPVRPKLALRRIDRLIALQNGNAGKHGAATDVVIAQTVAALRQVRQCHEAEIGGNVCGISAAAARSAKSAWAAARAAAESAAESAWAAAAQSAKSAWAAARAAARSAESAAAESAWAAARSAVRSAESAAWAAESAAWAAESAAWAAAESAAWAAAARSGAARSAESAAESAWRQEAADLLELLRDATP